MSTPGTVLITGCAGQDGLYLARELGVAGFAVVGTVRPGSEEPGLLATYAPHTITHAVDLTDTGAMTRVLEQSDPDVVVNLAAVSSVATSWREPHLTSEVNAHAVQRLLDVLVERSERGLPCRFVQASSAEEFGGASPYAQSKREARRAVDAARARGLGASVVTFYNHESPLRPSTFVTRKITGRVAEIATGRADRLTLGDTTVRRDWGFAGDYAHALRLLVESDDAHLTVATGVSRPLSAVVDAAFAAVGITDPAPYLSTDPALLRPAEIPEQVGDPTSAREALGWEPRVSFEAWVSHMVAVDLERWDTGVEHDPGYLFPGG